MIKWIQLVLTIQLTTICPTKYKRIALQIICKLLTFLVPAETSSRSILLHNWRRYILYQTCVDTTFWHGNGLKWNCTFNWSICNALQMHIVRFFRNEAATCIIVIVGTIHYCLFAWTLKHGVAYYFVTVFFVFLHF